MQLLQLFTENTLANSVTVSDITVLGASWCQGSCQKLQVQKGERRGLKYYSCFQEESTINELVTC